MQRGVSRVIHAGRQGTRAFVRDFMQENAVGQPYFKATRRRNDEHQCVLAHTLRSMFV